MTSEIPNPKTQNPKPKPNNLGFGHWALGSIERGRYLADKRTVVPVTLKLLPFASVPAKFVCAVWAVPVALHHRVRIVVDPLAAILKPGFDREVTTPSKESTRSVIVMATPPVSRSTCS